MEQVAVKGQVRNTTGTRASRALREEGRLPAVIYGHGEPPEAISLEQHDLEVALAHGARLLEVDVDGKSKQYLIKEVQHDHLDAAPIHVDLARVDLTERVKVNISIELRGVPKGISDGGVLDQLIQEIEVECLVTEIPEILHPLVTHLNVGDSLLIKDLDLPGSVEVLADEDAPVATVRALLTAEEPEEAEEAEETGEAEPERIGRVRKDEEGASSEGR